MTTVILIVGVLLYLIPTRVVAGHLAWGYWAKRRNEPPDRGDWVVGTFLGLLWPVLVAGKVLFRAITLVGRLPFATRTEREIRTKIECEKRDERIAEREGVTGMKKGGYTVEQDPRVGNPEGGHNFEIGDEVREPTSGMSGVVVGLRDGTRGRTCNVERVVSDPGLGHPGDTLTLTMDLPERLLERVPAPAPHPDWVKSVDSDSFPPPGQEGMGTEGEWGH